MKDAPTKLAEVMKPAVTSRPELAVAARIDKLLLGLEDDARRRVLQWIQSIHMPPLVPCRSEPLKSKIDETKVF